MYNYDSTVFKILFKKHPVFISLLFFSILVFLSSFGVYVLEFENPNANFDVYFNCIYYTVITLCTVGYGDYSPVTEIGWFYTLFLMVIGIIAVNLINYSFIDLIKINDNEKNYLE